MVDRKFKPDWCREPCVRCGKEGNRGLGHVIIRKSF